MAYSWDVACHQFPSMGYRTLLLNAEAVQTAEKALALMLGLQVLQSHFASLGFLQLCCSTLVYLSACLAQAQEGLPGTGGRDPCAYTPALSCHLRSFVSKTLRVYGPIQVCQGVPRLEATSRCLLIPFFGSLLLGSSPGRSALQSAE